MLLFSKNKKQKIISFSLFLIFFVLSISSVFLFFISDANTQELPVASQKTFNQIDMIVLFEGKSKSIIDNGPGILKYLRGSRQYMVETGLLVQQTVLIACLIIYANICFHKKNKSSPIIALSMGGHAPPFKRAYCSA